MFKYRYVKRRKSAFRESALVLGSAVHGALAEFYRILQRENRRVSQAEMEGLFRVAWKEQMDMALPVALGNGETLAQLFETGLCMIQAFWKSAPLPRKVLAVEDPWELDISSDWTGELLPRLVGVFDAVVIDENGEAIVLEHKTGSRRWSEHRIQYDSQISCYSLAAAHYFETTRVNVQLMLTNKSGGVFEQYPTRRGPVDHKYFIETLQGFFRAVEAEAFHPCRDWHCDRCPYAEECAGDISEKNIEHNVEAINGYGN